MYVIAGLGNPKKEYDNTRHNIGFSVIDMLADKTGISVNTAKHKGLLGAGYLNGQKIIYYEGGKFRIPFNHLNANRLKINKYITVFLSKKAFRKYCFENIENIIKSE